MILITGLAGYIGAHTAIEFLNNGYDLIGFDSLETGHQSTIDALQKIKPFKFVKGDLKNFDDINNLFKENKIDAVIHFAAYSLVEESVKNPAKYYRNNVLGTLNLLEAMVENDCQKIVFSSTCATYGEPQYTPIDELHPQSPINAYGQSKLMVEKIMADFERAYGLKSIKLRYFNVAGADNHCRVGENHNPETHLIPNILKSTFGNGQKFKIFGDTFDTKDGTCVRDYVNVEDLARAHKLALEYLKKENKSDVFNLGTENGDSVKDVFELSKKVVGKDIEVEICTARDGDPSTLFANSQKAQTTLGWKPENSLEFSIKTAYDWECKLHDF